MKPEAKKDLSFEKEGSNQQRIDVDSTIKKTKQATVDEMDMPHNQVSAEIDRSNPGAKDLADKGSQ